MEKKIFPNRITIELTNRCNVSCTFCNRQKVDMEIGDMKSELFYKVINEAAHYLPVKLVLFFRGESLMVPELVKYIEYAKNKGLGPIQLASNGLALEQELADSLAESGIDFISFSLDTLEADVYDNTRLTGNLVKSMQNVRYFGEKCQERRALGLSAPIVQVSTINIDIYNKKQQEFIEYWKKYVNFIRVYEEHDDKGKLVNMNLDIIGDIKKRKPCRKIFTDFIIYWNGNVALCNYDWNETYPIGNVQDNSIEELWNSQKYEDLRKSHIQNNISCDVLCCNCDHWKIDYTPEGYLGKLYEGLEG